MGLFEKGSREDYDGGNSEGAGINQMASEIDVAEIHVPDPGRDSFAQRWALPGIALCTS